MPCSFRPLMFNVSLLHNQGSHVKKLIAATVACVAVLIVQSVEARGGGGHSRGGGGHHSGTSHARSTYHISTRVSRSSTHYGPRTKVNSRRTYKSKSHPASTAVSLVPEFSDRSSSKSSSTVNSYGSSPNAQAYPRSRVGQPSASPQREPLPCSIASASAAQLGPAKSVNCAPN